MSSSKVPFRRADNAFLLQHVMSSAQILRYGGRVLHNGKGRPLMPFNLTRNASIALAYVVLLQSLTSFSSLPIHPSHSQSIQNITSSPGQLIDLESPRAYVLSHVYGLLLPHQPRVPRQTQVYPNLRQMQSALLQQTLGQHPLTMLLPQALHPSHHILGI